MKRYREKTMEGRFRRYVVKTPGGCWLWIGATMKSGYGMVARGGGSQRPALAHRAALRLAGVEIPEGYHVDHLCRVRNCVNPMHLQPVPPRVNTVERSPYGLAAANSRKTRCKHGHAFDAENTYVDGLGKRHCRECRRDTDRRRSRKRVAA